MSDKYKIRDNNSAYFITMTTMGWIDVFTRNNHKMAIVDALKYCQQNKGLEIYGWVLMSSHLHAIVGAEEGRVLSDILRDFKSTRVKRLYNKL